MKTATEYRDQVLETRRVLEEEYSSKVRKFLENLGDIDNPEIQMIRDGVKDGRYHLSGILCDRCRVELVTDGRQNLCNPPTTWHICCGCGERYLVP